MGLFVGMSGIVGANREEAVEGLRRFADANRYSIDEEALTSNDRECLILAEGSGGVTVFYPQDFLEWDDACAFLSRDLGKPVFFFHIHDGDLWMYELYRDGERIDGFNTIPDYWDKLDDVERGKWRGDAELLAACIPGLSPERVVKYLVPWEDVPDTESQDKAYPSDESGYGSEWQLVDFMNALGFVYPVGDDSVPSVTYRFK